MRRALTSSDENEPGQGKVGVWIGIGYGGEHENGLVHSHLPAPDLIMAPLFDIDIRGLQQTIAQEAPRILLEPLSNALDTDATEVTVRFSWARGIATYMVEDNDPNGFAQLSDAFTVFAPSRRKSVATARGRFGFGEKEFVALCYPGPVTVATTSGTVTFNRDKRTERKGAAACRPVGSAISARVRLTRDQADAFVARLRTILVPDGVSLTLDIGGEVTRLESRPAIRSANAVLPTVLADDEGILRLTRRQTSVTLHDVAPGETPTLYELGVPVMAHPGQWHIDIGQKIPLSRSRDAVTPAYLRAVYVTVLDTAADLLTLDGARADWVTGALADAAPDTVRSVVHLVHGEDAVINDPSCPEATKRAIDMGRRVVYGGSYSADVWNAIRENEVLLPAGHYQELRGDVPSSPSGIPPVPPAEWRPEWHSVAAYARALCLELMDRAIDVSIYRSRSGKPWAGLCWANGDLSLNASRLSRAWWTDERAINELLIHEFAHHSVSDHLSDAFHRECCRIGSRLRDCRTHLADFLPKKAAA